MFTTLKRSDIRIQLKVLSDEEIKGSLNEPELLKDNQDVFRIEKVIGKIKIKNKPWQHLGTDQRFENCLTLYYGARIFAISITQIVD